MTGLKECNRLKTGDLCLNECMDEEKEKKGGGEHAFITRTNLI
jgi:hypothetical protein